jgi:hypothetical protein
MATDDWQASGLTSDPQLLAERKGIGLSATIIDTASVVGHSLDYPLQIKSGKSAAVGNRGALRECLA